MSLLVFLKRNKMPIQLFLVVFSTFLFVIYFKVVYNWNILFHFIYDVPSGAIVFFYGSEILYIWIEQRPVKDWIHHIILLIPLFIIPLGREFAHFDISGHLTGATIVGFADTLFFDYRKWIKILFWVPFPVVIISRIYLLDEGNHWQTYSALIIAVSSIIVSVLIYKFLNRSLE